MGYDKWATMRELHEQWEASYKHMMTYTEYVLKQLQCPSYRDAELAVENYTRALKISDHKRGR